MRLLDRFFIVVFLITIFAVTAIEWVSWRCSGVDPCRAALISDLYNWQVLITGVLVLAGAILLMAPRREIRTQERSVADPSDAKRLRAARMRLAYQLQLLAETYDKILRTSDEVTGELKRVALLELARPASYLPLPPFVTEMSDLTVLAPEESEALLELARGLARLNAFVERFPRTDRALLERMVRIRAARTVLVAIYWRNRFASEIGWRSMRYPASRRKELQTILADTTRRATQDGEMDEP
jgi:hypothetical protein